MDLSSGYPYWTVKNGLLGNYPILRESIDCDVLVVGAGVTGALIAWKLIQDGHDVCVIDHREAGWGSTAASTALLQYEIDTELQDLVDRYGLEDALLAYRACATAISALARLAGGFRGVEFRNVKSLYYASKWLHQFRLRREAALRQKHGFDLRLLESEDVEREFGFQAPVAILSAVAAQVDPYRLTHRLLAVVARKGKGVFDRTRMVEFSPKRGFVHARTDTDVRIRCRHLVLAGGYETQQHIDQKVAANRSSYALITDPVPEGLGALKSCVLWESSRPYAYVRSTADRRLLIGGEDDKIDIPLRRDARVLKKARKLIEKARALFPGLTLDPAFAWAGTFAETKDGLPFFGPHEQHGPRVHFAMAYGGNGITYSMIGAELIAASLAGRRHPCASLFAFDRLRRC